jgi:hypothetical protein
MLLRLELVSGRNSFNRLAIFTLLEVVRAGTLKYLKTLDTFVLP